MGQPEPGLHPAGLWNSHSLVQARGSVTHGKSPVSSREGWAGVSRLSREQGGQLQLTQACAAHCTRPGRPRRNLAPRPPSPTGKRQRPGYEGHSCPQCGVKPGTEGSAHSNPVSWAVLGKAKLLLLPLSTGSFFRSSCPSMRPQPDALSILMPGALVQHCSSFLSPCWQHPLLGAAPGSPPTKVQDVDSSRGAASS